MSKVTFKSNENAFFRLLKKQTNNALNQMGKVGINNIKKETPVLTGKLKRSNIYDVKNNNLYFINEADYASFVEMGSIYQTAQPFMRTGIINSNNDFINIMVNNLKV